MKQLPSKISLESRRTATEISTNDDKTDYQNIDTLETFWKLNLLLLGGMELVTAFILVDKYPLSAFQ